MEIDVKAEDFNPAFMMQLPEPKPIETSITEVITATPILLDVGGPPKQEKAKPVLKEKVLEQHDY